MAGGGGGGGGARRFGPGSSFKRTSISLKAEEKDDKDDAESEHRNNNGFGCNIISRSTDLNWINTL